RGVKKPGSKTVTSALRGIARTEAKTRSEVMALIRS
ncbi:MAG: GTP cyclohydrolase I FolE, partial [Clostridiaceae bacterium]|nr:GTP cyclohydrolase I FolE [Clostridiaceae bacterium]